MRRVALAALLASAVATCQDPARAPIPLAVTAEPAAQTAGGLVTLTSAEFAALVLIPASDTTRPNRWSNFSVIVGDDTAESWRIGPTRIVYRVPAILTGNHEAIIKIDGHDDARAPFYGIGLAFPPYGRLHAYTSVTSGTPFPPNGLLIGENAPWPGFATGYGLLDMHSRQLRMLSALRLRAGSLIKVEEPGPSYRARHFLFDASPTSGPSAAELWSTDPYALIDSVACRERELSYAVAELGPGTCLVLPDFSGLLIRNGIDTLLRDEFAFREGQFRMAPGGRWTVIRTTLVNRRYAPVGMRWPVLDQVGNIAYTIDTLFHVTGAAFSRYGDTLFATVSTHDPSAPNLVDGRFSLVVLESATGRMLASRSFPAERALQDVIRDPAGPVLYVGGMQYDGTQQLLQFQQYLTVLDSRTLEVIADMPAPPTLSANDAVLVHGGSAGRVTVYAWCGFDCGGLWVFTFDLP